ncbi:MAG TPA: GNAT family N-acetyltransferase [Frankiaceae bacterium]|nr:GNAT family N-acetyltransferase [Frankiaceae bacterium]
MITPYAPDLDGAWDDVVASSVNGTFLHTRRYLGYHGDRFADASVVVRDPRGRLVGVLPAALDPRDPSVVVSHPGITYGGLVHDGSVRGEAVIDVLTAAAALWRERGCATLRYKAVPYIYHRVPAGDDLYALFRLGAHRYRCDLSAALDLGEPPLHNRNRRRNLDKARAAGVTVVSGREYVEAFWPILTANLRDRYGVDPVHSTEEIALLADLFPQEIECQAVLVGDELVAGAILYKTPRVVHPQYSAATPRGRELWALDAAFAAGIAAAREAGARYYDFGNSNEEAGRLLNTSLYAYKVAYGGGGVPYEFYEWALD